MKLFPFIIPSAIAVSVFSLVYQPNNTPLALQAEQTTNATSSGNTTKTAGSVSNTAYGPIQVEGEFSADAKLVAINILQAPSDNPTSSKINSDALPTLVSSAISVQGDTSMVESVSGATYTSEGFKDSLASIMLGK